MKEWKKDIVSGFLLLDFVYFLNLSIHPSVKIIWNLLEHKETILSKCPGIIENMAQILDHMVFFSRSYSKILL